MPRPRSDSFPRLQQLALRSVVQLVLKCCQTQSKRHTKTVSKAIPVTLADDYMMEVISRGREWSRVNLRNAMCPWCTHLNLRSTKMDMKVARNLGRLKHLTCLTVHPDQFGYYPSGRAIIKEVVKHLPKLQRLKSLVLKGPVTDDVNLFGKVVDCPSLEDLSFEWGMSPNQPVTLESCQKLKRVCVKYRGNSVEEMLAIMLAIPQLDTLTILHENLEKSLLKACHGTYHLRRLKTVFDDVQIGNDVESLALHFPELQEVRLTRCDDLSPINSMVHVKELELSECTANQVSVLDGAVLSHLVSLHLTEVRDLQAVLGVIRGPLQGLERLRLMICEQVDLVQINNLFPNLSHLKLFYCQLTSISRYKGNPFMHLERLMIMEAQDAVSRQHLAYLLSHSYDLDSLEVIHSCGLDDTTVHYLLQLNPMTKLKKLYLCSDRLTPSVASVIFDNFGKDLESAEFDGEHMDDLPNGFFNLMQEKVKPYFFNMRIGHKVHTIHKPGGQMHLIESM